MGLTRHDVQAAARRIEGRIRRTPLLPPAGTDDIWLKCEFLQHCGVFKTRGAFNHQLSALEALEAREARKAPKAPEIDDTGTVDAGIVIASGGNAGLAHAFAARELGLRATVFVPESAPVVKVDLIRSYGAEVRRVGTQYAEAYAAAVNFATETGGALTHAYDQPEVAAGAGTIAEEILHDEPSIDTIILAVGGGGLYAGVAAAARGRARVVAVEPRSCPTLSEAMAAGRPVDVEVSGVAADSLGARSIGALAFAAQLAEPPVSVLVEEDEILRARARLWSEYRIASETGAATAYAALLTGRYQPTEGERVALVVCGANTDPSTLG